MQLQCDLRQITQLQEMNFLDITSRYNQFICSGYQPVCVYEYYYEHNIIKKTHLCHLVRFSYYDPMYVHVTGYTDRIYQKRKPPA